MNKLPTIITVFFILITFERVAHFVDSQMSSGSFVAYAFAGGLGVAIFGAAYFTRDYPTRSKAGAANLRTLRKRAWSFLIVLIVFDGAFNLADVINTAAPGAHPVFVVAFGLFPTLAAMMFGILQGNVDTAPPSSLRLSGLEKILRNISGKPRRHRKPSSGRTTPVPEPAPEHHETPEPNPDPVPDVPVYQVKNRSELTSEMLTILGNGHAPDELRRMFPQVTPRTIREWKRTIKREEL